MRQHFWHPLVAWALARAVVMGKERKTSMTLKSACGGCLAFAVATFGATQATAAPVFGHGDMGTFGLQEDWDNDGLVAGTSYMNSVGDQFAQRFTVLDTATVDRVWQRVSGATDATFTVGIMADDGSGNPTGVYLTRDDLSGPATVSHVNPGSVAPLESAFGDVTLSPGVYHVVSTLDAVGEDFNFRGSIASGIRNYDRALDPNMATLTKDTAGSWIVRTPDPYLGIGDSGGPNPDIAQQVYSTVQSASISSTPTTPRGQRFTITEHEVPAGAVILVSSLQMGFSRNGIFNDPLLVHLRRGDGTILAAMTVQNADATGSFLDLTFDPVFINQGEEYLVTTQFGGAGGTSGQSYRLSSLSISGAIPNGGNAGWGGTTFASIIQSSDGWSTWTDTVSNQDLRFTLFGQVFIPEPATVVTLALALIGLAGRRRQPLAVYRERSRTA